MLLQKILTTTTTTLKEKMNTKPKQNRLKILRAERDMAKTKLSGQPSFASLLSPNDKMRQRHIAVRDANRYAQSHNPQVATKLEPLPVLQGYPRAEFHSLNFPSACLRKTGARNKTSIGNFFPPFCCPPRPFSENMWREMIRNAKMMLFWYGFPWADHI